MTTLVSSAIDIEQDFVNHLQDQTSLEFVMHEGISSELLLSPLSKSIFQFVQHQHNATGKVPTLRVLQTEFPAFTFDTPETTVQYIIEKLRIRYQRNQVGATLEEVAMVANSDPQLALSKLRDKVFEIERTSLSQRQVFKPGDHKLFIHDLQQKVIAGLYKGVSMGFADIDAFTGGIKHGNLAYILARPKRKKTFFTLQAFIQQVYNDEFPYLFTLENTDEEIKLRISCMLSGVSWDTAIKGGLTKKDWKDIEVAWDNFSQHEFRIEMPPLDERTVNHFTLRADKVGAGPILISQFKYIKGTKDWYRTETEEKAEVAVELKQAATRPGHERPIIVEAQFNRGGDSMEELEDFDASKVGLTDMIPQSADILFGIFENKDMRLNQISEYGILESRNTNKAAWFIETELITRTDISMQAGSQH